MDKETIDSKYFNDFINTTTDISNWRISNNNHIFSIYKYTILITFANVAALLFSKKYTCTLLILLIVIMIFSWIIAFLWYKINSNYKKINEAKFNVIKSTCEELDITSYFHEEYSIYNKGSSSDITIWENCLIISIPILISTITLIILLSIMGG